MHTLTCKACNKTFEAKRSDAETCSDACRSRLNRERRKAKAETEQQQATYKAHVEEKKQSLLDEINKVKFDIKRDHLAISLSEKTNSNLKAAIENSKASILNHEKEIEKLEKIKKIPDWKFWEQYIKPDLDKATPVTGKWDETLLGIGARILVTSNESMRNNMIKNKREEFKAKIKSFEKAIEKEKSTIFSNQEAIQNNESRQERLRERIKSNENRLIELDKLRFAPSPEPKLPPPRPMPLLDSPMKKETKSGMTASDLLGMDFDTFRLPGELGRFLGDLERNKLAIALTGDSGAGKSYFSFTLAKLFLDSGYTAKYFSLEEGLGNLTKQKLIANQIGGNLALADSGTIREIRKDANHFDLILIDSFNKLDAKAEYFDALRNAFPKTIFISIFQKRDDGKIRGGSQILFDSSATIDIRKEHGERVAFMKKGRYGTNHWKYSIDQGIVIEEH